MISNDFININNLPIIILNNWNEFDKDKITNNFYNIKNSKICLSYYKNLII